MSNLQYRVWQIWHTDYGKFAILVSLKRNFPKEKHLIRP